jgi:aminoacyl tRNA synthase complex-interacting multifunctional protein 1
LSEELQAYLQADLRVGKIVECSRHPESAKLYIEKIDLGEGRLRTIGSGLQEFIPIEQMTEGLCVVFANLKPRKLADIMSEGMVMCAGNADHT